MGYKFFHTFSLCRDSFWSNKYFFKPSRRTSTSRSRYMIHLLAVVIYTKSWLKNCFTNWLTRRRKTVQKVKRHESRIIATHNKFYCSANVQISNRQTTKLDFDVERENGSFWPLKWNNWLHNCCQSNRNFAHFQQFFSSTLRSLGGCNFHFKSLKTSEITLSYHSRLNES